MTTHYNRVIAAVDGSEGAGRAAAAAAKLAKGMGKPLTLLYVFTAPGPDEFVSLDNVSGALIDPARLSDEAIKAAKSEAGKKAFKAAHEAIGDDGVEIEEEIVTGRALEAILKYAESHDPSVVVVGRRGLGRVGEFLLGSVSAKLVHQTRVPVMVV